MKLLPFLLLLLMAQQSQSQKLSKLLWDNVKDCDLTIKNSMEEEDMPEEESELYDKLEYDPKNGFLHITGTWPTCGCGCDATVAGFKDEAGKFTLLRYEYWNCDNKFGVYSSRNIEEVMPDGFGFSAFTEDGKEVDMKGNSYFYLKAEIPQKGTDTKVSLQLFPLGMTGKSKNGFSFNSKKAKGSEKTLWALQEVIEMIDNDADLDSILNNKFNSLPENLILKINSKVGDGDEFKTMEDFLKAFSYLNKVYQAYSKLKYSDIILSWDRSKARFSIKSKSGNLSKITFLKFLKTMPYYSAGC